MKKGLFLLIISLAFIGYLIVKYFSERDLGMPPYYVVERINGTGDGHEMHYDTVFHRLRDFDLVNQLGHHVNREDLAGKVSLVAFFHTSGKNVAPRLSDIYQKIQDTYLQSQSGLQLLCISTDPEEDSVDNLKKYADHFRTNHDMWWFLTGPLDKVLDMAKTDFHLTLQKDSSGHFYSPQIVLLDREQYVRGYFNMMDSMDVKKCVSDISLLMIEKTKNEK